MRNIEIKITGSGSPNQVAQRLRDLARELDSKENVSEVDVEYCESGVLEIELKEH